MESEEDDSTGGTAVVEDQFTKVAVEGQNDLLITRGNRQNVRIRGSRRVFHHPKNFMMFQPKKRHDGTVNVFVCKDIHGTASARKTVSSDDRALAAKSSAARSWSA